MIKSFVEKKFKELITTGVLALEYDEDDEEYCTWALEYFDGKIVSDSGQCYPDVLTEEQAKQVIINVLGQDIILKEIQSLSGTFEEDGICMGTEENSVYYACDHDAENTFYKTTYGNMCNGIVEDEEVPMTIQEVLEDIQRN